MKDCIASFQGVREPCFETPNAFVKYVEESLGVKFTLDAAADEHNTKAPAFINEEMDALKTDWRGVVWCNPPYGSMITPFLKRAVEMMNRCELIAVLIPARMDTKYMHEIAIPNASEIYFIKGRLNFQHHTAVKGANAPYASVLIVFRPYMTRLTFQTLEPTQYQRGRGQCIRLSKELKE